MNNLHLNTIRLDNSHVHNLDKFLQFYYFPSIKKKEKEKEVNTNTLRTISQRWTFITFFASKCHIPTIITNTVSCSGNPIITSTMFTILTFFWLLFFLLKIKPMKKKKNGTKTIWTISSRKTLWTISTRKSGFAITLSCTLFTNWWETSWSIAITRFIVFLFYFYILHLLFFFWKKSNLSNLYGFRNN